MCACDDKRNKYAASKPDDWKDSRGQYSRAVEDSTFPKISPSREALLKYKYNLALNEYFNMLEEQDTKCIICQEKFVKTPNVDHCHSTGRVRGLLCWNCNSGLGLFRDNVVALIRAAAYLEGEL